MKDETGVTRPAIRAMIVFGTRPEAVKLAPIVRAMDSSPRFETYVVATAQHREMLDQVTRLFGIVAHVDLDLMRPQQQLADLASRALVALDRIVGSDRPDLVVVQGDTTTTLAAALAAHFHRVPVVHVEAGLRTHLRYSPFPEEMNRRLTSCLASLHLVPTLSSRDNLLREGIDPSIVIVTGNPVIDALLWVVRTSGDDYEDTALAEALSNSRRVVLVTAHRRESWGEGLAAIGRAVARLARADKELLVILPLHPNPAVREALLPPLAGVSNVLITDPLGYADFARLLGRAYLVMTDSGGVQEEAPSLGKPVLVLRKDTERPEGITAGTAKLVGTDEDGIFQAAIELLKEPRSYERMARAINPYGDGHAAERSLAAIERFFSGYPGDGIAGRTDGDRS